MGADPSPQTVSLSRATGRPRRLIAPSPATGKGDLLMGGPSSYVATLVERQSRYVVLVRLPSNETHTVVRALTQRVQ